MLLVRKPSVDERNFEVVLSPVVHLFCFSLTVMQGDLLSRAARSGSPALVNWCLTEGD